MTKKMRIEVYRETAPAGTSLKGEAGLAQVLHPKLGDWRWRLIASNGKEIACSGEGYARKSSALNIAEKISHEIDLVVVEV